MANWYEIRIPVTDKTEDAILNFLFELGCGGCQQVQGEVIGYFSTDVEKKNVEQKVRRYLIELEKLGIWPESTGYIINDIPDQDWNAEWKKFFKPIAVSEKFMVKPTWEKLEVPTKEFVIEIDPKQAFGTGVHETTQLMLQFLEDYPIAGKKVLDVGTGTGILAIAAMKLGADEVVAFDNDPAAIAAAEENISHNLGETNLKLLTGSPDTIAITPATFNVVLANITKNVIFKYFEHLTRFLRPNGFLIISGILVEELEEVKNRIYRKEIFKIEEIRTQKEWVGLVLQKKLKDETPGSN